MKREIRCELCHRLILTIDKPDGPAEREIKEMGHSVFYDNSNPRCYCINCKLKNK